MDREKIIKGLELCKEACYMEDCPYWNGSITDGSCILKLHDDALFLLKEQEAVKPTWSRGKPFCGACGLQIRGGKFCGECGKPIAWEGR